MVDEGAIGEKFRLLAGELNERQRRQWAATEARAAGRGGIAATARATGIAVDTIRKGIAELASDERLDPGRVRRPGAGRRALTQTDPTLLSDLERLVDQDCRGDPESLLRWTATSTSPRSPSCLGRWVTACRPTSRPGRGPGILTVTPSSATSTRPPKRRWRLDSR